MLSFKRHFHYKWIYNARGRGQCCSITLLHMNRINKTESANFASLVCSLLPEDLHSEYFLSIKDAQKEITGQID